MATKQNKSKFPSIPRRDATEVLYGKIRDLKGLGYSYNEICDMLNVSKTTALLAVKNKGRAKKNKPINRKV